MASRFAQFVMTPVRNVLEHFNQIVVFVKQIIIFLIQPANPNVQMAITIN